ncbi:DinB family protein [Cytobacillus sp. IB215665]|uniref:DinB family protein n=1 Tax=Cytobacillus sp. IB215665 TaxID=3097357 RepID=UPI002A127AE1|nr:DinB family protein [Cytobacillus sp. IB215665]MDX8365202.1 DinB family protein [Cytobacillus sp. IB215665]
MDQKEVLLEQMITCHEQKNWFVPLTVALKGVSADQAMWKEWDSNSIWEIVNHLTFWNERYLKFFKGAPLPKGKVVNEDTFDLSKVNDSNEEWAAAVSHLCNIMSEWIAVVKESDQDKLYSIAHIESGTSWSSMIANFNTHNAYHIGQIVQIRKIQGVWDSSAGVN